MKCKHTFALFCVNEMRVGINTFITRTIKSPNLSL